MTYQFSLKTYRIFFLPLSVLKFRFEVPYIHHQARHSTWHLIFSSSKKCYWITLLIIALSLSSPMIHIFSVLSETFFKCQIFRFTSKNLFFALSFHFTLRFSQLYLPNYLLSFFISAIIFLLISRSSFMFFPCFFYGVLVLYHGCNILLIWGYNLFSFPLFSICFGFHLRVSWDLGVWS